jgi:fibronectin-binding autotransporter adhesin
VMSGANAGSIGSMVTSGFTSVESYTGGGTDSLTAPAATTITVNAPNAGQVGAGMNFSGVNTLLADAGGTTFSFSGTGTIATITGGAGTDTINIAGLGGGHTVTLASSGTIGGVVTAGYTSVESFTGASGDSLQLPAGPNGVTINAPSAGSSGGLSFSGFGALLAGPNGDMFDFTTASASIGTITGGAGSDTIQNSSGVSRSVLMSGANAGSIGSMVTSGFTSIESYTGGGTDNLTAPAATTITVNAPNAGQVGAGMNFSGVNTLLADAGGTTFNFTTGTASVATVTGGAGSDTIQNNSGATRSVVMSGANAGSIGSMVTSGFTSVESYTGGGTDNLTAPAATAITVNAPNAGQVSAGMSFSGVNALVADAGGTSFVFGAAGSIGTVTGGAGIDTIDISSKPGANTIDLQAGTISGGFLGSFANIERFVGDNVADVLIGTNAATTWTVTSLNSGTLSTGFSFTNIPNLTGNANNDAFILSGGTLTGSINGGGGVNTLSAANVVNNWAINGANSGTVTGVGGTFANIQNLTGGTNTDTFVFAAGGSVSGTVDGGANTNTIDLSAKVGAVSINLQAATFTGGGTFTNIGSFIGNDGTTGTNTTLTGANAGATFTLNSSNRGTVGAANFSGVGNLVGGTGNDTLRATSATWTLNGSNQGAVTNLAGTFSGIENLMDLGTGTFNMHGTGNGSITGNLVSTNPGSISYASYTTPVTFELGGLANQSTGVAGTWSGLTSATGSSNADTIKGTGQTYTLDNAIANKASNGTVTWTSFENLADTAGGTFNMGTGGSVTGNLTAVGGTVGYATRATPATFNLNGGASTGMAGWSGITSVTGSAGSDMITGSGQTYTVTGSNAGTNGTVSWTSIENLTDLSTGTLRATSATWTLNGSNTGSVSNLSGTFAGMGNLTDLGTGSFNMHGSGNGSISGSLSGGTNGTMNYAGYTSPVTFSLSGAGGTTTGVGGTRSGVRSVSGSGNSDTITGSGATYNLTAQNAGNSGGLSWASFENISDPAGGTFNLAVGANNVSGTLASGGSGATLNSAVDITSLNLSVPSTLTMTGTAGSWNLTGAPQPALFQTTNPNANVTFNGACIGGPACGTVITIVGSISATVSQIASQALKDAQSTDSVAKQIDYGFAGDVGTTPPMDHRIDETGISTPDCLEESREARACKN